MVKLYGMCGEGRVVAFGSGLASENEYQAALKSKAQAPNKGKTRVGSLNRIER